MFQVQVGQCRLLHSTSLNENVNRKNRRIFYQFGKANRIIFGASQIRENPARENLPPVCFNKV